MNKTLARLALLAATAAPLTAVAQKAPDTKPAAQKPDVPPLERVLPEVNFNGNALGDVIDFLRDVTGFNIVLVRPQGMNPADDPAVTLRLKNASLGQVLAVLTRECPIEVSTVPAARPGEGEITVVKIIGVSKPNAGAGEAAGVRVYHLTSIVDSLRPPVALAAMLQPMLPRAGFSPGQPAAQAPDEKELAAQRVAVEKAEAETKAANAKERKDGLNDVLSLCKAALDEVGGTHPPTLQVHEATQTLIFKGSPEQQAALEDVLRALDPNHGDADRAVVRPLAGDGARRREEAAQLKAERDRLKAQSEDEAQRADERLTLLRERNQELQATLDKQRQEAFQRSLELERLKIRLEAAEKAGAKTPPGQAKEQPGKE